MDKKKLVDAVEEMSIQAHRSQEEQFFIRMVKQVWQIDWSVSPSDVLRNLVERNQAYFSGFMALDNGDEREENWLLDALNQNIELLTQKRTDINSTNKLVDTIDELNQLRFKLGKQSR